MQLLGSDLPCLPQEETLIVVIDMQLLGSDLPCLPQEETLIVVIDMQVLGSDLSIVYSRQRISSLSEQQYAKRYCEDALYGLRAIQ